MRTFGWDFWKIFIPFLILIGIVLSFPYWFTQYKLFDFDFYKTGQIGATVGGILGPFIAIIAACLTFIAFWVQYKANEKIKDQFKQERFETKFYELLKLHQSNVAELEIDNRFHGRKAFVRMYEEIRFIYAFIEQERMKWNDKIKKQKEGTAKVKADKKIEARVYDKPEVLMELAYTIFFFGLDDVRNGFKTNFIYIHNINTPFAIHICNELYKLRKKNKGEKEDDGLVHYPLEATSAKMPDVKWKPSYKPFGGQVSKLGHYYRHLYQLVKLIAGNTSLGLTFDEKYQYIKTVRAQLSNHEQAMIYFNSFFKAGEVWWSEKHRDPEKLLKNEKGQTLSYFLDYRIIKNLPFNLTRFGPNPEVEFANRLRLRGFSEREIEEEKHELFEWIGG